MFDIKSVKLRSEEEIISSWRDKEKIKVSVLCATYNHESFIADAITGFLMQETDFAFEVIIHDDASTDGTANIVREYQAKYPNIIKPIYQTENQYSKGKFKPTLYMQKAVKGAYLALCEGDDYWITSDKLQKQLDICEKDPGISFVGHGAVTLSVKTSKFNTVKVWSSRRYISTLHDILSEERAYGQFSPTASYFIKEDVFKTLPDWFADAPTGDYFLEVLSAVYGKMVYLPEVMSVYRVENEHAWTGVNNRNPDFTIKFLASRLPTLNHFKKMVGRNEKKLVDVVISDTYDDLMYWEGQKNLLSGVKYFCLSCFYVRKIRWATLKRLAVITLPRQLLNNLKLKKQN